MKLSEADGESKHSGSKDKNHGNNSQEIGLSPSQGTGHRAPLGFRTVMN